MVLGFWQAALVFKKCVVKGGAGALIYLFYSSFVQARRWLKELMKGKMMCACSIRQNGPVRLFIFHCAQGYKGVAIGGFANVAQPIHSFLLSFGTK